MAVTMLKLTGEDIPEDLRRPEREYVVRITDADANVTYRFDEEEAAAEVVRLSNLDSQGQA